jgi:hypothetical protein
MDGFSGMTQAPEKGEECVQGFDRKARRKETTWKTKAYMEGWDQNGS